MAEISKSVLAAYGMQAHLVPADIRAKLSRGELEARLAFAADLSARAGSCGNRVLAGCYGQVAKAALTARPEAEVVREARVLRAKAAQLGSGLPADSLRRRADDLEAANPQPPRRAVVRKAGDPLSADQTSLMALYDCTGQIFGVAEAEDIVPVLDPDVIMKAASAGMVATHDPATGKPTGFVSPDAITPVTMGTGKTGKTGKPGKTAAPDAMPAAGAAEEQVAKARTPAGHVAAYDQAGKFMGYARPQDLADPATAQARNMGPVRAGGTTGMGQPRTTGPGASLPFDGPQAMLPGDAQTPDRQVVKAAQRAPRTADGRVLLVRDLPRRSAGRKG